MLEIYKFTLDSDSIDDKRIARTMLLKMRIARIVIMIGYFVQGSRIDYLLICVQMDLVTVVVDEYLLRL